MPDTAIARAGRFVARHFVPLSLLSYLWGWAFYAALLLRDGTNPLLRFEADGTLSGMIPWKATQYYVNYPDHGFVRRGLIGTIFQAVPRELAPLAISVLSALAGLVAILLFARLFRLALDRVPEENRGFLHMLMAVVALSPLGVCQIAYDAGRYDVYGLIALLLAAMLLLSGRAVPAFALAVVAMLIHEAFAIYGGSVLVALAFIREHPGARMASLPGTLRLILDRPRSLSLALGVTVATLAVVLRAFGESAAVADLDFGNGHIVWVGESMGIMQPLGAFSYGAIGLGVLALSVAAVSVIRLNGRYLVPLVGVYAAPFLLYAAGNNWARFLHLQTMTFIVFTTLMIAVLGARAPRQTGAGGLALLGLVALIPLGPIGITDAFPYLQTLVDALSR